MPVSAAAPVASGEPSASEAAPPAREPPPAIAPSAPVESGGAPGPDPTRFGDWERRGRCIDF